jgi:phosphoglycolate phosphatase
MTASMPIKAVLFDLDGTLVDSARDRAETLNRLLAEEGVAALSPEAVKDMIGDGVGKLVERGLSAVGADPSRAPADRHDLSRHNNSREGALSALTQS